LQINDIKIHLLQIPAQNAIMISHHKDKSTLILDQNMSYKTTVNE